MEGYFIGKSGRDWYVCKVGPVGPERVLTGGVVDVVNFMAGVAGEDGVPARFTAYAVEDGSGHHTPIGEATRTADGGIDLTLRALPLSANGRIRLAPQ